MGQVNAQFGKYIVVETNQGWHIAYNKNYGEAPYIVLDPNLLLLDKQTLRRTKSAIRFIRRDQGGWQTELRKYL